MKVSRIASLLALAALAAGAGAVSAQTTIVNENFDSYPTFGVDGGAAFKAVWEETIGNGAAPVDIANDMNSGIITNDATTFPGIQGNAVDHIGALSSTPPLPGMVNQFGGYIRPDLGVNAPFQINPTASLNVSLKFDLFVGTSGNERMTVGLRHTKGEPDDANAPADADTYPDADTTNIFELGCHNGVPNTPIVPGAETVSANYAFRIINFGPVSAPLTAQPNWQYFKLPAALDRTTDADAIVNVGDIGAGWHTYAATFSPTEITLTLDLFRDGFMNVRDENGAIVIGSGAAGPDVTLTLPVATHALGFNNIRIGGSSGGSSPGAGAMAFDNILLETVNSVQPGEDDADFDGDGDIDGEDFLTWQRNLGTGDQTQGDADGDGNIDNLDLDVWKAQFGTSTVAASAVPEPAACGLALLALTGLAALRRRS